MMYLDIIMDGLNLFFLISLMLYCVDGAIKGIKNYYKNKKS